MRLEALFYCDKSLVDITKIKKDLRVVGVNTRDGSRIIKDCWVSNGPEIGIPIPYAHSIGLTGEDLRPLPSTKWEEKEFTYRHNQEEVINAALPILKDVGAVHLNCPTGWGKSPASIRLAQLLDSNVLVISHKVDILKQFEKAVSNIWDIDCGWIHGKKFELDKKVTLSTVQTLSRRIDSFDDSVLSNFTTVVWDEAHHMGADSYTSVASKLNTRYTIGLSATFRRKDKLDPLFEKFLGPKVAIAKIESNTKKVLYTPLVDCKVTMNKCFDYRTGDFSMHKFNEQVANDEGINNWALETIEKLLDVGRRPLIFCYSLQHVDKLHEMIPEAGVYAGKLNGKSLKDDDLIEAVKKPVLIATPHKMGEGTDLENLLGEKEYKKLDPLDTCIILGAKDDTEQQIGRVGRNMKEGSILVIHPVFKNLAMSANKLSKAKKLVYDKKKFEIVKEIKKDY